MTHENIRLHQEWTLGKYPDGEQPSRQTECARPASVQPVVSVCFGELKLSGCEKHPDRLDLVCAKIRQINGTALTTEQVWEVLNELSAKKAVMDAEELTRRLNTPNDGTQRGRAAVATNATETRTRPSLK